VKKELDKAAGQAPGSRFPAVVLLVIALLVIAFLLIVF